MKSSPRPLKNPAIAAMVGLVACATASVVLAQDAFEAALRSAPQPSGQAGRPTSEVRASTRSPVAGASTARPLPVIAAAGVVPPRFLAMTSLTPLNLALIQNATRRGELDGFAMLERLAGPLPLPDGARPLRCRPADGEMVYTLGVEASPAYMAGLNAMLASADPSQRASMRGGRVVPSEGMRFVMTRETLAASPTSLAAKRRAEGVLLAAGMVRGPDFVGQWSYRSGPGWRGRAPIRAMLTDDAFGIGDSCRSRNIVIPHGPTLVLSYDEGL